MSEITARNGQSIFDLCIQGGYKIENIYQLMVDNDVSNINEASFTNKIFIFNPKLINDFGFQNSGVVLLSGEFVNQYEPIEPTGSFLLRQDGGYLLRQDGYKFIRQ